MRSRNVKGAARNCRHKLPVTGGGRDTVVMNQDFTQNGLLGQPTIQSRPGVAGISGLPKSAVLTLWSGAWPSAGPVPTWTGGVTPTVQDAGSCKLSL